jgi:hypothetical protein
MFDSQNKNYNIRVPAQEAWSLNFKLQHQCDSVILNVCKEIFNYTINEKDEDIKKIKFLYLTQIGKMLVLVDCDERRYK